jgi:hypothetical protein
VNKGLRSISPYMLIGVLLSHLSLLFSYDLGVLDASQGLDVSPFTELQGICEE